MFASSVHAPIIENVQSIHPALDSILSGILANTQVYSSYINSSRFTAGLRLFFPFRFFDYTYVRTSNKTSYDSMTGNRTKERPLYYILIDCI